MNNGKLCISVAAESVESMLEKIRAATAAADIVEVRADHIPPDKLPGLFDKLKSEKTLLLTMRPIEQGGRAKADLRQRMNFWMAVFTQYPHEPEDVWYDNEFDLIPALEWPPSCNVIRSYHDFGSVPKDLNELYETAPKQEILKIAYKADDITDTIPAFELLEKASADGRSVIAIAMGEPGKITRILGGAYGSPLTYASFGNGEEIAPGQISAEDLMSLFRVKELDRNTDVYGTIAGDTSYSMSPHLHNSVFAHDGANAVFVPLQVRGLDNFIEQMVRKETRKIDLNFKGFAVTNPHKQNILKHIDHLDETAQEIGAVNTVRIESDGTLSGFNTDAEGFITPLKNSVSDLAGKRAAVIGAGGAARACVYALLKENAEVAVFARDPEKAAELGVNVEPFDKTTRFDGFDIVINATPLGTKGEAESMSPVSADALSGVGLVYDLTYNPAKTLFMKEAEKAGAEAIGGLEMLVAQAAAQYKIWTSRTASVKVMKAAAEKHLKL
jgi:3-dehydroquinate dehydratase/shikimate dehydrogenase